MTRSIRPWCSPTCPPLRCFWTLVNLSLLGCGLPAVPGNPGDTCEHTSECLAPARCFEGRCYHVGSARCDPNTTEGTVCLTGLEGACATGHLRCTSDTQATCVAAAAQPYDLCNDGIDNDCDGQVNEGDDCSEDWDGAAKRLGAISDQAGFAGQRIWMSHETLGFAKRPCQ